MDEEELIVAYTQKALVDGSRVGYEMGLYPIGVIGGKFVIYVPKVKKAA